MSPRGTRGPTKRSKGEGALFKRADGMWIGRLDLGWDDEGNKIRPTVSASTKAKAVERLRQLRRDIEEHGFAPKRSGTLEDWLTYWLSDVIRVRPGTHSDYTSVCKNHIIPSIGHVRLDLLEPRHIRQVLTAMERKGKTSSRRQAYIVLNKALKDAKADGRITRVVTESVTPPNPRKEKRSALTAGEARTVLQHVAGDRLGSLWATYLLTGIRRGEGAGITIDRVDLDRDVLDVAAQVRRVKWKHGCDGDCGRTTRSCPLKVIDAHADFHYTRLHGGLYLVEPKSDKGQRLVPIVPWLRATLERRLEQLDRERGTYVADHGLVWPREDGHPYDPNVLTHTWDQVLSAAGVPDVDLHSARHTTGTLLLEAGTDVHVVEAILGHTEAATSRGYQHVDTTLSRAAMLRMEQLLELEG